MKNLVYLMLTLVFFLSCKNTHHAENSSESSSSSTDSIHNRQTYAEISIRKGGSWKDQKYLGGEFENVVEVQLPKNHTDHSGFLRYEGPGWENQKVAYRLYLDWRNAIDIFGKKVDTLVLPYVGQDGFSSYHENAGWGQDILKAGESLGIGGFGRFVDNKVVHFSSVEKTIAKIKNTDNQSSVHIEYKDWKTGNSTIDLEAILTIFPSDLYTKVELEPSEQLNGLTTGIVKKENIPLLQNDTLSSEWGYIATYGPHTLVNPTDKLGMAVFYKKDQLDTIINGQYNHLVVFKPTTKKITYYFLGAWEQQKNGLTTKEEFEEYLRSTLLKLESKNKQ